MSSTPSAPPVLSAFRPLSGGHSEAIAPGPRLVTLGAFGATWWEDGAPVTATLPSVPVDGARWSADGKTLRVGLGALDLAARAWTPIAALATWNQPGRQGELPVRAAAWLEDGAHVALLLETRAGQRSTEIAVVTADGRARGRRPVEGASALATIADRVLVAGRPVVVLDLDGNVIAEPAPLPDSVSRVRAGAGMFAALGAAGAVALIRPGDGAVLATWDVRAVDAVPIAGGVVAIELDGKVHVGCLDGHDVRTVAQVDSQVGAAVIQRVGDQVVVAGAGATPVRVAALASPCR